MKSQNLSADKKWGVFRQRESQGEMHVIPCYHSGLIVEHHIVDVLCPCQPTVEGQSPSGNLIVVHQE